MKKISLAGRKPDLSFVHKESEIAFDPTNKFHRSTFTFEFEKAVYDFIESFVAMIFTDEKFRDFGALPRDRNMTSLYFDIISEFENVRWERFSTWYYDQKARLQLKIRGIVKNAIDEQSRTKIKGLEFFAWLSVESLISVMVDDYFAKNFEKLNIVKDTLHSYFGTVFEIILRELYEDEELDRIRLEKTGEEKARLKPLINRYALIFNDIADMPHVEKIIFSKDASIYVDKFIIGRLGAAFDETLARSKKFEKKDSLKSILADQALVRLLLKENRERKFFFSLVRKDRELKQRMVAKNAKSTIRRMAAEIMCETGSGDLINFIKHADAIEDLLTDAKLKKYMSKSLKSLNTAKARELAGKINEAISRAKKSAKAFFGGLSGRELAQVVYECVDNFCYYLATVSNYYEVRSKYGRKSAYSDELVGIKIMRQSAIKKEYVSEYGREIIECVPVALDQKTRIENVFEEGSLFYIREEGNFFVAGEQRVRGKKLFMFADLRNSTETTMKLTKDTASFLTPYLNAVYKISTEQAGNEIYFAGDGYAAHFNKVSDAIRAAYLVHREFAKLRKESQDKIRVLEKDIAVELAKLGAITADLKPGKKVAPAEDMRDDIKEALELINAAGGGDITQIIMRTAEEYSMPKVEMGIGITEGELFIAVIGDEGDVRFNIVLSPSLTQAARLSGSTASVKAYVEKLYGIKNIPRRVYVQNRALFNYGIVITSEVFKTLCAEVEVCVVEKGKTELTYDVHYYYDRAIDRYICLSKLEGGVALKGIDHDVDVFEVFTSSTAVDPYMENFLRKQPR